MFTAKIGLNKSALKLFSKLCDEPEKYNAKVECSKTGATLVDAGLQNEGGYLAGEIVTEICLAGYGRATITPMQYGDALLPSVFVWTDHPALSLLGSQFAGWQIKANGFSAFASGPGRALALEPKGFYEHMQFKDDSDVAVLVLETETKAPEAVIQQVATKCGVPAKNLFFTLFSAKSLTGATQLSGRVVETGLRKLERLGLDPLIVKHAWGYAPIVPVYPKASEVRTRARDAVFWGGVANYTVECDDEQKLQSIVSRAPSSSSNIMREAQKLAERNPRFSNILQEAGFDYYKVDADLFSPAVISINNSKTGKTFRAGDLNVGAIKASLGLS